MIPACNRTACWLLLWTIPGFSSLPVATAQQLASSSPLGVAHRGLLLDAPENTLANFKACLELRMGFEFDVRRTRDGHLVSLHDDTLDRTTSGRGKLADWTLAEVQKLDAGSWFSPRYKGEKVPTVEQVFELLARHADAQVLVAVDLKGDDESIERDVLALARKHGVLGRLLFIGRAIETPAVRARLRASQPDVQAARLAAGAEQIAEAISDRSAEWVYVRHLPTAAEVQQVHAAGKRVFISGPKVAGHEPGNWKAAIDAGVDAILTDYSLELARQLRQAKEK
jgi:glycerophosphoryl diester phosphodiesterase